MPVWDDVVSDIDREVFERAGWGNRAGFGHRPVIMVIDVNYNFVGDRPEPILESIKRWHFSCGERGWDAVSAIEPLLARARARRIPVIYTTNPRRPDGFDLGVWNLKSRRSSEDVDVEGHFGNEIVAQVAPRPGDIFIEKKKPSAFFGTPLASYLVQLRADTLILTGTTTSGCVRATAVDGISYNFRVVIPEECVFDRGSLAHKATLFDLDQKYCDVTDVSAVFRYLESIPIGAFDGELPSLAAASQG